MGIKVSLEQLKAQTDSIQSATDDLKSQLDTVTQQLDNFNDSNMSGASIESVENFITGPINITLVGSVNLLEKASKSAQKLVDEYQSQVDSKSWSEEELQTKIDQLTHLIQANETKIDQINQKKKEAEASHSKDSHSASTSVLEALGRSLNKQKDKYQEILDHLRTYAANSSTLIENIDTNILQAINVISTGYKGGTGKDAWDAKSQEDLFGKIASDVSTAGTMLTWGSAGTKASIVLFDMIHTGLYDHVEAYGEAAEDWVKYLTEFTPSELKVFMKEFKKQGNIKDKAKFVRQFKKKMANNKPTLDKHVTEKLDAKEKHAEVEAKKHEHPKTRVEKKEADTAAKKAKHIQHYNKGSKAVKHVVASADLVGKGVTAFDKGYDIYQRTEHGESLAKATTKEVASLATGAVAGAVVQGAVSAIPIVGPIAGPIAGAYVSGKVEDYTEKQLDKHWK